MITVADLQRINTEVNAIPYQELPGPKEPFDWWTDIPVEGNSFVCRDFVLMKSDKLRDAGLPPTDMFVILCWTEIVTPVTNPDDPTSGRIYHATLGVDLDGETWVLDSRFDQIYRMSEPPVDYRYDRRQVPGTVEFVTV